ncbi:MAG: hypothetical protein K6F45_08380 [Saccharofermentans sp.]|nr:hypothetical protein [Saccharofermentans sp.]
MRSVEEVIRLFEHVCWYPSAGSDFRPLLFLSDWYYKKNDVPMDGCGELCVNMSAPGQK